MQYGDCHSLTPDSIMLLRTTVFENEELPWKDTDNRLILYDIHKGFFRKMIDYTHATLSFIERGSFLVDW